MLPFLQLPPAVASAPTPMDNPNPPQSLRYPSPDLLQPRPMPAIPQDFLNYRISNANEWAPGPRPTNYLISPNTIPIIPVNRHPTPHGWTPSIGSVISPLLLTPSDPTSNQSYVQQRSTSLGSFREVRIDSHTVHQRQQREPHEVLSELRSKYSFLPADHPLFHTASDLLLMNGEMGPIFRRFSLGNLFDLQSLYLAIQVEMRGWLYPYTAWSDEEVCPNYKLDTSLIVSADACCQACRTGWRGIRRRMASYVA